MSYEEKRVRVARFGSMSRRSPLLVTVPGTRGPLKLHRIAAAALERMSAAIERDLGIEVKLASAWRPHRWKSREHYEETLIAKYGSVKAGRRWLAYNSPHETGLSIDFGVGGLEPKSKTAAAQRKTPLHQWLVAHAHEYGWHPYKVEPWHWEFPMSLEAYKTGEGDPTADDAGPLAFGPGDDDSDDAIEELDEESALWFSGEAVEDQDQDEPAAPAHPEHLAEPAPRRQSRSGEVAGEVEADGFQVRWKVRWSLD